MMKCPYCGEVSEDIEFCDSCGRMLQQMEEEVKEDELYYKEESLNCAVTLSDLSEEEVITFNKKLIQPPIWIQTLEDKNKLYFAYNDEVSLKEFIEGSTLKFDQVIQIMERIGEMISLLEDNKLILGMFNLEDFWIKESKIETMYYRQNQAFFRAEQEVIQETKKTVCAPELYNEAYVNQSTDVYLLGELFLYLVMDKKVKIENYEQEKYIAYNSQLFEFDLPLAFHNWIGKTINLYPEERYESVEACLKDFRLCQQLNEAWHIDSVVDLNYEIEALTDVGQGKAEEKEDCLEKANEDSYIILQDEKCSLLVVADGISNCHIGTGYDASHIITDVTKEVWEKHRTLLHEAHIKEFIAYIVTESNLRIKNEASKLCPEESLKGVMGSTLSIGIIVDHKFYYSSMGDSPIYLLRDHQFIPLCIEDNVGNESLKKGVSWRAYKENDEKSSLTRFIGGSFSTAQDENLLDIRVEYVSLKAEDRLLICSDGLTDYINSVSGRGDQWCQDYTLKKILEDHKHLPLEVLNQNLVNLANEHGGGDNITVITAKIESI